MVWESTISQARGLAAGIMRCAQICVASSTPLKYPQGNKFIIKHQTLHIYETSVM
jgi:hypothetical protein